MLTYIETKQIKAIPMNRLDYNKFRGWELPIDENGADDGYLVEYLDGDTPNTTTHEGYVSWSPKEQFENAYRPVTGISFGLAIEALKLGKKVTRAGWNGKGMWLSLSGTMSGHLVDAENFWSPHNIEFAHDMGGKALVQPCITMKTAVNTIQMGWVASQSDMLADDWMIV